MPDLLLSAGDFAFDAIDEDAAGAGGAGEGISVPEDDVCVFSDFEASDAVFDA